MSASVTSCPCCSMDSYTLCMMESFQDELEKRAVNTAGLLGRAGSFLKGQAGAAGAGLGVGAASGGLLGAGVQGVRGYQQAKEQGATTGQALMGGVGGAVSGGLTGAAIGGGLGGVAGLAGGARARGVADKLVQSKNPLGATARFGQRQLHSVTGYADHRTPEGLKQLNDMRAGSWGAKQRMEAAQKNLAAVQGKSGVDPAALQKAQQEASKAGVGLAAAEKAQGMGLTSLPGYLKSLAHRPIDTIRAGAAEQWHGSGLGGKFLFAGVPALGAAGEALTPSEEGGPGKVERTSKALLGGLAFGAAPIPLAGMSLLGMGAERLGGIAGAGVDAQLARRARAAQAAQQGQGVGG